MSMLPYSWNPHSPGSYQIESDDIHPKAKEQYEENHINNRLYGEVFFCAKSENFLDDHAEQSSAVERRDWQEIEKRERK